MLTCVLFITFLPAISCAKVADKDSFDEPLSYLRQKQEDAALDKFQAQKSKILAMTRLAKRKAALARHEADEAAAAHERIAATAAPSSRPAASRSRED